MDKKVVEDILKQLTPKFGQAAPLTTFRGKILDYLGIKIDYHRKGKVTFPIEFFLNNYWKKSHMTWRA